MIKKSTTSWLNISKAEEEEEEEEDPHLDQQDITHTLIQG